MRPKSRPALYATLASIALLLSPLPFTAAAASRSAAKESAPEGFAQPANPAIAQALAEIHQGDPASALKTLAALNPATPADRQWKSYAEGLALYELKKPDEGFLRFTAVYDELRSLKGTPDGETFRLIGAALKKIGWYWRDKKEFEKAYAYHSIEYNYYEKYGSPLEIHDAAISLDVDSFALGDMRQSEIWLRRALVAGARVTDPLAKTKALAMAYNNLAEPLYTLKRFPEALEAIQLSLKFWTEYEQENGTKEFRVLWGNYGLGDVYENWALSLKADGKPYKEKKQKARAAYRKALELAEHLGLPAEDKKTLADRLAALEAM